MDNVLQHAAARSAFTIQALGTMGEDPLWDELVADYLRFDALQFADSEWGIYASANEEHDRAQAQVEHRYGEGWRKNADGKMQADRAYAAVMKANAAWVEQFLEPFWQAGRNLAIYPAPTLAAALFKVALIHREDLSGDAAMPRDVMLIVAEDMARLGGSA